jgi:hypothetical protein
VAFAFDAAADIKHSQVGHMVTDGAGSSIGTFRQQDTPGAAQTPGCCLRVTIRTGISRSWKRSGPTPPEPDGTSTNGFGGVFNLPLVHGWTPGHPVDHQRPGGAVLVWPWPDDDDVSAGGWLPDQRVSRLRRQIMQLGEPDRGRLERSSSTFQQNKSETPGSPSV